MAPRDSPNNKVVIHLLLRGCDERNRQAVWWFVLWWDGGAKVRCTWQQNVLETALGYRATGQVNCESKAGRGLVLLNFSG